MFADIYRRLVGVFWDKPRCLIERFLEDFDCSPGLYIVKLPAGYGKTSIAFVSAISTLMGKCSSSTIYVAPLRSLVDDVYYRWRSIASKLLSKDLVEELSGVQHMGVAGSIYLNKPVVYTTMDTFILHLFKLPPPELQHYAKAIAHQRIYRGHYEVSRGLIANSTIILDEPHLTIHSTPTVEALLSAIRFLAYIKSVVILLTATLPQKLEEMIVKSVNGYLDPNSVKVYSYGENGFVDIVFEEEQLSKNIRTEVILDRTLKAEDIAKATDEYDRVLVVVNRRTRAIRLYSEVKKLLSRKGLDDKLFLLHGFMLESERRRVEESVRDLSRRGEQFILITTQVVEAGFDISSDILLTEIAPPPSLIQRVGRVARWDEGEGVVKIYRVESPKPYRGEELECVGNILRNHTCILWKTPKPSGYGNNCIDYMEFLEKATMIEDKGVLGCVYNVADYMIDSSGVKTLLEKVLSGELLREHSLILPLYVKDRLDEGSIPIDLYMLSNLLKKDKIIGYVRGYREGGLETSRERINELKDIIMSIDDPISAWVSLEVKEIRGLVIDNSTYEELAYGS